MEKLTAALRECVAGRWGMLGRNDHLLAVPNAGLELIALGDDIRHLRPELGLADPFALYDLFFNQVIQGCGNTLSVNESLRLIPPKVAKVSSRFVCIGVIKADLPPHNAGLQCPVSPLRAAEWQHILCPVRS